MAQTTEYYVSPQEIGDRIQRSPRTLERWRAQGVGPPFIKLPSGGVLYRESDVDRWLDGLRETGGALSSSAGPEVRRVTRRRGVRS